MKAPFKFFLSLILFLALVSGIGSATANALELNQFATTLVVAAAVFCIILFDKQAGNLVKNGVEVEFWVNYIIERFRRDNMFLNHAFKEDQYVVGGKIVHIPQPGSKPTVVKGRTTFPATAVRRTDDDVTYNLDEYTTDPTHIQDAEKVELSFSKIDSILGDHAGTMNETVGDDMIIKWASLIPEANIIETGGVSAAAKIPGQTGNRLTMVHTDLKKARLKMNLQNVPGTDRFALLEENMADEFTDSLTTTQYKDFSHYYDAATGVIGKLYGFNIMTRSSVAMAAAALNGSDQLVVNALGAAVTGTDTAISLCWQKNCVTRAMGEVKFFEDVNNPLYYGDVYSALLRMGGRRRRKDNAGVVAIKQATAV